MQPTNKLRFVEREVTIHHADCLYASVKTVRVLQQRWEETLIEENGYYVAGEWRDVPLEVESE